MAAQRRVPVPQFKQIRSDVHSELIHPAISSSMFVEATKEHGGASMDVATGRLLSSKDKGVAIGGELDSAGKPIETSYIGRGSESPEKELRPSDVDKAQWNAAKATGGRKGVLLGSWVPSPEDIAESKAKGKDISGVNLDVSGLYPYSKAAKVFKSRPKEAAGYDISRGETVANPNFKGN